MNWSNGFSASYYAAVVDPKTWRDIERIEITGGHITRSGTDLRESADIDCAKYPSDRELWLRIYLNATQGAISEHEALFTGLACSPSTNIEGVRLSYPVECYSVLKPAQDVLLQRGWYAPAATNGARLVQDLLSVTPAPVIIEDGSPALQQAIVAESGETRLTMSEKILTAIGWRLKIAGDGTINICRKSQNAVAVFDALSNDIIEPKITLQRDWYDCPNVFRAVQDELSAIARDDDEDSFLSTVNRGREIWMEETSCVLNDGETIASYAMRRLKEEQSFAVSLSYDRRYQPNIHVSDSVHVKHPRQGINDIFTITSQSINLTHGARVTEKVSK